MNKNDEFIQQEMAKQLKPGEQVVSTALVFQGPGIILQALLLGPLLSWLVTKYFFAVLTNQRLVLIRTKMGFWGLKRLNLSTEEIQPRDLASIEPRGLGNQERIVLGIKAGGSRVLRLNTLARIAGQKTFADDVPRVIRPLLTA